MKRILKNINVKSRIYANADVMVFHKISLNAFIDQLGNENKIFSEMNYSLSDIMHKVLVPFSLCLRYKDLTYKESININNDKNLA